MGKKLLFDIMPKSYLFTIISLLASIVTYGNDYGVFARGSSLEPVDSKDINIEVKEEILTIRLTDETNVAKPYGENEGTFYNTKAYVDVDYTFYNHGEATDMLVAFVAYFPSTNRFLDNIFDGSPYIHDFTVEVNGQSQPVTTSVPGLPKNYKQELLKVGYGHLIYEGKYIWEYLYTFPAKFVKGENKVHHTYSYDLCHSFNLWNLEYALSPASHWKGGKIGKFTLRVECPNTAKHFYVNCEDLQNVSPIFTKGVGKQRKSPRYSGNREISMRDAVAQWTMYEYSPKSRLDIYSVVLRYVDEYDTEDYPCGYSYDRTLGFRPSWGKLSGQPRILRNMPYAHRGYVFKTKEMKKIFEKLWWYIPDSTYVPDMSDFTERELEFINGTYKEKKEER